MKKIEQIISEEVKNYKKPTLIYDKSILRERLEFFGKFAREKNVNFLFTIKSFPHKGILKTANKYLMGFDASNVNEYSMLPEDIKNKIIVINNPTSYSKNINEYLKNGNDIIYNLDNITHLDELIKNTKNSKKITLGMRLSHTDLNLDLNSYAWTDEPNEFGSRFGEPLNKLSEFHRKVGKPVSIHLHNGSEHNTSKFYIMAAKSILDYCTKNNVELKYMNLGGGQHNMSDSEITNMVNELRSFVPDSITIIFEPGNTLSKDIGFGLSKVVSIKKQKDRFVVFMDASYECNFKWSTPELLDFKTATQESVDVYFYGPTCYESDFMMNTSLNLINGNLPFKEGDILVFNKILGYCFAWNTSFNGIPKAGVKFV